MATKSKTLSVTGYRDNADGTTTNYLSDGTVDTGKYSTNKRGGTRFEPIQSKTADLYNQGIKLGQQAATITGVPFTPATLNGDTLKENPIFKLPNQKPSVGVDGLLTELGENAVNNKDAFTQSLESDAAKTETTYKRSLKDYVSGLFGQKGKTELSADAYSKEGGVDDIQSELDIINNDILKEQSSLENKIRAIEKNPTGMLAGAVADEVARAKTESLRRQADMSVIQMGIQGRYDSAKEIADRAVAIEFEREENKNEALRVQYEDNKDLFTTAEQRKFETAQADRERILTEQKEERKTISELAINAQSNGAPTSLVQQALKAKTQSEAIALIGPYVDSLDRQLKQLELKKLKADIQTKIDENKPIVVTNDPTKTSAENNLNNLLGIFGSAKVSAANKTSIGNALSLAKAAQDLADANASGDFAGFYPLRGVVDKYTPEMFKRSKTVSNEALISALDLQTQFWASGAALSDPQTALVKQMIPVKTDTDRQVKVKVNQLINYMLSQTASRLSTDGVEFKPQPVDMFETVDLLEKASPDQLEALREAGLTQ